jgi:hypothetical protein
MFGVFQLIESPPLTARRVCTPRLWCRGRTHSLGGEGVGGQYFGRRQTLLCTLLYIRKYFVGIGYCWMRHYRQIDIETDRVSSTFRSRRESVATCIYKCNGLAYPVLHTRMGLHTELEFLNNL